MDCTGKKTFFSRRLANRQPDAPVAGSGRRRFPSCSRDKHRGGTPRFPVGVSVRVAAAAHPSMFSRRTVFPTTKRVCRRRIRQRYLCINFVTIHRGRPGRILRKPNRLKRKIRRGTRSLRKRRGNDRVVCPWTDRSLGKLGAVSAFRRQRMVHGALNDAVNCSRFDQTTIDRRPCF